MTLTRSGIAAHFEVSPKILALFFFFNYLFILKKLDGALDKSPNAKGSKILLIAGVIASLLSSPVSCRRRLSYYSKFPLSLSLFFLQSSIILLL